MRLYKLTDHTGQTYNNTQWGEGVTHSAPGTGEMCSAGWIHAYESPVLALLMNPVHASADPLLWEAEGEIGRTDGTKCGVVALTTLRCIPLPMVTLTQRIAFGILAAKTGHTSPSFHVWADNWLSGKNRSAAASAAATVTTAAGANAVDAAIAAAAAAAALGIPLNLVHIAEESLQY